MTPASNPEALILTEDEELLCLAYGLLLAGFVDPGSLLDHILHNPLDTCRKALHAQIHSEQGDSHA